MASPGYGWRYEQSRRRLLALGPPCAYCGAHATTADHVPPLALHAHVDGSDCCVLVPACQRCNARRGAELTNSRRRSTGSIARGSGWSAGKGTP